MPRSKDPPPPQGDEVICMTCNRLDVTGNFVQCDACDAWCHFTCAGVDASVSERVWVCGKCRAAPSISGKSGCTSKTGSSLARELERLKQQQEIELKRANLVMQMKFLDQQQELLNKAVPEEEARDKISNVDQEEHTRRTQEWVNQTDGDKEEGAVGGIPLQAASLADHGNQPLQSVQPGAAKQIPGTTDRSPAHNEVAELRAQLEICMKRMEEGFRITQQTKSQPAPLVLPSAVQSVGDTGTIPKSYPIQTEQTENQIEPPLGLTAQQLVARQSLARDLPTFSGDPAEWPIFISSYNYTTAACGYTDGGNMIRLQRCLRGSALESVRSRLVIPSTVPQVIDALQMRYGRPELLINALLQKVRSIPAPRADRLEGLVDYGTAIQALCDHIEAANEVSHLANPTLLQELVAKLPSDQKMMWAGYRRGVGHVDLRTFCNYMQQVVEDATSVLSFEADGRRHAGKEYGREKTKQKGFLNSHTSDQDRTFEAPASRSTDKIECGNCGKMGHRIRECREFKSLSVDNRWRKIRSLGICQNCLFRHGRRSCRTNTRCGIDGCEYRHHPLLHSALRPSTTIVTQVADNHTHRRVTSSILFRIIPVTLYGEKGIVNTFAFFDEGSSVTMVEENLMAKLGITGSPAPLCLRWTANTCRTEKNSQIVSITISGEDKQQRYKLVGAQTVESLNLPRQSFHYDKAVKRFEYLKNLPLRSYENATPRILIGVDNLQLAVPLKVREGDRSGPVAAKTRLGWCVYGQQKEGDKGAYCFHVCECTPNEALHESVKRFFAVEEAGSSKPILSVEDQRAQQLLQSTTRRVGERYETGLLWRTDYVELPDSYPMAVSRMKCLERRMDKDPSLKLKILQKVQEYVDKGYAHVATEDEIASADPRRVWFLPLGAVTNPKKPSKVRIIWDAAATVDGSSLNSHLLKGPDQLTALPSVLFRFRQFGIAYPRASQRIVDNHYVDDYLDSFEDEDEAKQITEEVRTVHRNGGFNLRNWNSNSGAVLEFLDEPAVTSDKNINLVNKEQTERVLGMLWATKSDELRFATQMSEEVNDLIETSTRPTKRQVLRCVMTFFDPLGLLATFLIHGKVLIQELWRTGIDWDEKIGDDQFNRWRDWIRMIQFIDTICTPRCYFDSATRQTYEDAQIHVFVDASPAAYCCVVYIRVTDQEGYGHCSLAAAKAKVAPLKPMSIPRLELQGCVLGSRMLKFVQENHSIAFTKRFLWTDSTTALSWINSDASNYRPFVAHRVVEIQDSTNSDEWKYVPSSCNPADEGTKWGKGPYFHSESQWFVGPQFLTYPEEHWPRTPSISVQEREELRKPVMNHVSVEPLIKFERFSKWEKLQRTVAYVLRFLHNLKPHQIKAVGEFHQQELQAAEAVIIRQEQWTSFPEEMATLTQRQKNSLQTISKASKLYQLVPALDEQGVMRQNGRIGAAKNVSYNMRYPVIHPKNGVVTMLIVDKYHRAYKHANPETVVNEIRQNFEIPRLRSIVRRYGRHCQYCKLRKAIPSIPPMAPLPAARLAAYCRPFSYVGLDNFGPLLVKQGRANVKRWIALFTCLTVRAVHLEVVSSLTTSSCVSAVRRFIGRRGAPVEFYSDNGTNFQGAERLLRGQIERGLSSTFTSAQTKWLFIPPGAPHMGGAWERMVQSVKAAMGEAYGDGKLDEEGLWTLVVEAESMVNSRPLTYLPLDAEESEALTPNHFLLGSSSGIKEPSHDIRDQPRDLQRTFLDIQDQRNSFWKRWLREYLPVIRRQPKWFDEAVREIKEGDLVLITEDGKRSGWTRGRVKSVIHGQDGKIRQAILRTANGYLRRPVTKIALLDVGRISAVLPDGKMHPAEDVTASLLHQCRKGEDQQRTIDDSRHRERYCYAVTDRCT
ncbi:uncharacterized protein LOC109416846 [Aedes albopictus]|uniref:Uncharacterized protein n=1 Tax=Aedes albopictus TaxID=7160 RepID=A0ABM1XT04_AEDAL